MWACNPHSKMNRNCTKSKLQTRKLNKLEAIISYREWVNAQFKNGVFTKYNITPNKFCDKMLKKGERTPDQLESSRVSRLQQLKMELPVVIFTVIASSLFLECYCRCTCTDPPTCDCPPVPKDRCKRGIDPYIYPYPGTWYKDTETEKFYYHLGKTVFVERSDGYYAKWVTSGDGAEWSMSDNYLWQWDRKGRWYILKEDDSEEKPHSCSKFLIPIKCVGTECPKQVRYPSDGKWWNISGEKIMFETSDGAERYELQSNGMYRKFNRDVEVCPDNWTWNATTGLWYGVQDANVSCDSKGTADIDNNQLPQGKTGPTGVREGVIEPPRKVFTY